MKTKEFHPEYRNTFKKNLKRIESTLESFPVSKKERRFILDEIKNLFGITSQSIINKWDTGRKTCRTSYMLEIMPDYPQGVLELSLTIDAIINIFDDLYDEPAKKEDRLIYLVELMRSLSNIVRENLKREVRESLSRYLDNIILIAMAEQNYCRKIKQSSSFEEKIALAIKCYDFRSLVMDIFVELPILELKGRKEGMENIISLARIHRAVCLVKKDLRDLGHDIENQTETPVSIIHLREGRAKADRFIDSLIEHYKNENMKLSKNKTGNDFREIAVRLKELIYNEIG